MPPVLQNPALLALQAEFGQRLQENAPLERYTSARVGGVADVLLEVTSAGELAGAAARLWELGLPFIVLGGGSNVLVSDAGLRGVVLLNRARRVRFFATGEGSPAVWAESGANFGLLARQAARRGLAGLEWAAGIPGTLGGAVVGNAGAHDGDMAGCLRMADILQHKEGRGPETTIREEWPVEKFAYAYRSSLLKREPGKRVVLGALLGLQPGEPGAVQARLDDFVAHRRRTQPPGASMGSMFKNPPGDVAGRLIEAAGLKGARLGQAQISPLHANFFLNLGHASASDVYRLIRLARQRVADKFGVELELEIELVGEWDLGNEE